MTLIVAVVGLIAIVLLGGVLLRFRATVGAIQQADPRQPVAVGTARAESAVQPNAGGVLTAPFNVLLIGVDKRPNPEEGVRSDTLIVVHVDPQQKSASMLSIPRDSVVQVPNFGQAKINTAFGDGYNHAEEIYGAGTEPDAGGGALAAETVEQFLGVKIDYIAQVDFNGFAQLVDAIGGVAIDVERPLLDAEYPTDDYGVERIYIPAGLQVMDGRTALIYARSRHSSDDFGRGKRQQQVLRALLNQVKARGMLENVGSIGQWVDVLTQNVRTTLPLKDPSTLADLVTLARELSPDRVSQISINPNDVQVTIDGSDLYWNQADIEALLARWQSGAAPAPEAATVESARVQVVNAAGVEGIATKMTSSLRARGFALADPVTATQPTPTTRIIDYTGKPETARQLAEALGIAPELIQATPGADAPPPVDGVDVVLMVGQDYKQEWLDE